MFRVQEKLLDDNKVFFVEKWGIGKHECLNINKTLYLSYLIVYYVLGYGVILFL